MAKENYDELCEAILEKVGGKSNIITVGHCITRLRFKLADESKADTEGIEKLPRVIKVMNPNGQYHVVVGNDIVEDVYDSFLKVSGMTGAGEVPVEEGDEAENKTVASIVIDLISGIFAPLLGPMCAAGMMKGILALVVYFFPDFANAGAYIMLYTLGDGFYYFLPVILAITAGRKFGMGEFSAACIGLSLVYPTMVEITGGEVLGSVELGFLGTFSWYTDFFGIPVIMPASGYTSSVIPIILMVAFGAQVEKWTRSWIPNYMKMFFTPLVVCTVSVVLGYLVIGPVATCITNLLGEFFSLLFNLPVIGGVLGSTIVGAFWMCLVIFGFHWSLIPLMISNLGTLGYDYVACGMIGHSFALGAIVFAMMLKNKDENFRGVAIPAIISSFFFGVTEPALYGAALPDGKAFVLACACSGVSGAIIGLTGSYTYMSGGLGVFTWLSYINPATSDISGMIWAIVASLVAAAIGFVIEFAIYKPKEA